jgi:hypothetical protein
VPSNIQGFVERHDAVEQHNPAAGLSEHALSLRSKDRSNTARTRPSLEEQAAN